MKQSAGFARLLVATAIAGVAGYLIMWIVPRQTGFAGYAIFAIFWSFLFLIIGTLSGIQQEVTRATRPASASARGNKSGSEKLSIVCSGVVFLLMAATSPLWVTVVFPHQGWELVLPASLGAAIYAALAVFYGSLYGLAEWRSLFWLIVADALLRLAAISVVLGFTTDVVVLAWAVVLPFPVVLTMIWPFVRHKVVGLVALDVPYRRLLWNASRTTAAATAMGVLVSGFPLLLGLTSAGERSDLLGLLILATTLTRAPLVVVAMAFQSYLIVQFRDRVRHFWRFFLVLEGVLTGSAIALAAVGWWLGPAVFELLYPGELVPDGWLIATLVLSSALVGTLSVSGSAVLSRGQHSIYTTGWIAAALGTVICLLLPLDFVGRTVLALIVGPVAGIVVHAGYLALRGGIETDHRIEERLES